MIHVRNIYSEHACRMVKAVGICWVIALVLGVAQRGALAAAGQPGPASVRDRAAHVSLLSQQPKADCTGSGNWSWIHDYAQWHQRARQRNRTEDAKWVRCWTSL